MIHYLQAIKKKKSYSMRSFKLIILWLCASVSQIPAQESIMSAFGNKNDKLLTSEINALNQRCYDANADYWDRFPFPDFLPPAIRQLFPVAKGKKALDIGSGTGKLASWLKSLGFDVLCLDPSHVMIQRCKNLGLTTVQTTLQDYSSSGCFDLITAILSLIHIPKSEIVEQLGKLSAWQKAGGILIIATIDGSGERVSETQSNFPRFFAYYSKKELLNILNPEYECLLEHSVEDTIPYQIIVLRKR